MQLHSFFSKNLVLFGFLALLCFSACRKDRNLTPPDFDLYEVQTNVQQTVSLMQDLVYEATALTTDLYDGDGQVTIGQCPTFSLVKMDSSANYPALLTIDAGTGCVWRGHAISGTVTLVLDKDIDTGNAVIAGEINHLKLDQSGLNGAISLIFGTVGAPLTNCSIKLTNFTVTTEQGEEVTLEQLTAQRTQTAGQETTVKTGGKIAIDDDVFTSTVSGSGETDSGVNFEITTDTPVTRSMDCRWVSLGKISIKAGVLLNGYIDFGDGTCNNEVTLKVGNEVKTVFLK